MSSENRPRILCVDDEPRVLEALALHLRRRYDVFTAESGPRALEILEADGPFEVIVSDMRMPGMDGAAFLAEARAKWPDATRILLTGHSELEATIAAVNSGRIFRFLSKPCPPAELAQALEDGVAQYRLVTGERVLLEQTLRGAIETLFDVLTLVQPTSFGQAARVKQIAVDMAKQLGVDGGWSLEVAAMLSQLGMIGLPASVADKLYDGEALTKEEQAMVDRAPAATEKLLAHIPRLEIVRGILATAARQGRPDPSWNEHERQLVLRGGQILRLATEYAQLEWRGEPVDTALGTIRGRAESYPEGFVAALVEAVGHGTRLQQVREVGLRDLRVGMVLVDELRTTTGALLCPRGYEVNAAFVERAKNIRVGTVREPIRVTKGAPPPPDGSAPAAK